MERLALAYANLVDRECDPRWLWVSFVVADLEVTLNKDVLPLDAPVVVQVNSEWTPHCDALQVWFLQEQQMVASHHSLSLHARLSNPDGTATAIGQKQ